jgi:transposase
LALHDQLRALARAAAGRTIEPTAAVIDSQSVRAAPTVPKACRGWDNAKKVNGRKRHIAVDATGLLLEVLATPASVQDRDAARPLLFNLHRARRRIRLAWADGGYAGKLQPWAATYLKLTVQIVKRPDDLHTFQILWGSNTRSGVACGLPSSLDDLRTRSLSARLCSGDGPA